ncbi:MAG: hypothetical protein ACLVL2_14325 [Bacteroides cellulosilyticus]
METKNVWTSYSEEQLKEADAFAREYMDFLDAGKLRESAWIPLST